MPITDTLLGISSPFVATAGDVLMTLVLATLVILPARLLWRRLTRPIERKVEALACYESQQHRNYANPDYIWNLARTHGINIGREFAEVFEVYRLVT